MSFVYVCVCEREKVGVYNNKQFIGTIEGLYMYVHMYICSTYVYMTYAALKGAEGMTFAALKGAEVAERVPINTNLTQSHV
jgi:hypothetical protein